MSLAEILLLILFCFFVASLKKDSGDPLSPLEARIAQLESEIRSLRTEAEQARKQIADQKKELAHKQAIIDALAKMAGVPPPKDPEDIDELVKALRRGSPRCHPTENTLVTVVSVNGLVSADVVGDTAELRKQGLDLKKGDRLSSAEAIDRFLRAVRLVSDEKKCRFDYDLKFATDSDYRAARERFEKYMYPGPNIRQVKP